MITTVWYIFVSMLAVAMFAAAIGAANFIAKDCGKYRTVTFAALFCLILPMNEVIPVSMFDELANGRHLLRDNPACNAGVKK